MQAKVKPIILTAPFCKQCDVTKQKLDKMQIEYDSVDLTQDESAMEMAKGLGYRAAPVVIWGNEHWSGFRPDLIDKMAKAAQ